MKLYYVIASITIVTYLDSVRCMSINEFFSNGWDTLSSTWNQIKTAIKQPVRLKRLGPGGKRKTTKSLIFSTTPAPPVQVRAMEEDPNARLRELSTSTKIFVLSPTTTTEGTTSFRTVESTRPTSTRSTSIKPRTPKRTTTTPTTTFITLPPSTLPPTITVEDRVTQTSSPSQPGFRVNVPYIAAPVWRSVQDWKHMQRPILLKQKVSMLKDKAMHKDKANEKDKAISKGILSILNGQLKHR